MSNDLILCDIIATDTGTDPERVVVYDQNFRPPKDQGAFIIVALQSTKILSAVTKFLPGSNSELKAVSKAETFNVEITSKDRSAIELYPRVVMSLRSIYGQQKMEEENISIFRTGTVLDLSFIEGPSALHRFRIPVVIHSVDRVVDPINVYDRFQTVQEEIDVP